MNSLGRRPTEELGEIVKAVEEAATTGEVKGLVLMSGKERSFIAGADIREFESFDTEAKITEVVKQTLELFNRIDRLPVPVVAAIHGYCLGGGLELALACDWRIADREEGTRLGFPEVKLGIFPGLNGTVRVDPSRRADGRHDRHAHRPHAASQRGQSHRPGRSAGADPPHSPLGRAQGGAAKAPLEGRAVVEEADAEAAGALHAGQADARQDRREGARGALSGAVPPDRPVREIWRRSGAHAHRRDRDVHAADGERGVAQSSPRVQAVRDAEGRGPQGRLQAAQGARHRRRHHGRRHRRLVRDARHAGEPPGPRRGADRQGARPRQGPVQAAAPQPARRRDRARRACSPIPPASTSSMPTW